MAGVDGLTAPAALETLLNPDLTGPERPFVLAHEWAHLSGYAPEADANFVGLAAHAWRGRRRGALQRLAVPAERGGATGAARARGARRSPRSTRGPRQDLAAIDRRAARAGGHRAAASAGACTTRYLRSQGVAEGVRSYSRVVELIVRCRARRLIRPRLRPNHDADEPNAAPRRLSDVARFQETAMTVRTAVLAAALAVLAAAPAAAQPAPAPPAFTVPYEYFTLPNGLKVVVSPDRTAPVVLVEVMYNIGFRVEPKGRTGFAHLFEHMMFQGSASLKKLEHVQWCRGPAAC